jgi:PAP2 superfamily protein
MRAAASPEIRIATGPNARFPQVASAARRAVLGLLFGFTTLCGALQSTWAADAVTTWTQLVCSGASGDFDPHVATLMHAAMHDALNAITPRYARWTAAAPNEPPAADAAPEAAVAAAAYDVLMGMQPDKTAPIKAALSAALAAVPDGPRKAAGVALGKAIAAATLARRAGDRDAPITPFSQSDEPGHWRATPPDTHARPRYERSQPFSGPAALDIPVAGPPELGSPAYLAAVAEVRSLGRETSTERSEAQTDAAQFFAAQSSHINFLDLAIRLLAARPAPQDIWDSARTMTLLSIALSDSFTLAWNAKERFHFWRPVTAIRQGGFGVTPEADWQPLVPTPEHPEHPSGHATECTAGAAVMRSLFGNDTQPLRYVATDAFFQPEREYPGFTALAHECAASRVWAGVHFRTSSDAGQRLGEAIAEHVVGNLLRPVNVQK